MVKDRVRVFGYDQRSSGRSTGSEPFTVARWIADLEGLRSRWGVDSWIVAGHSFGAAIALACAAEQPGRVRGLVVMSCLPALGSSYQRGLSVYRRNREARVPRELADRHAALRSLRDSAPADEWRGIQRELGEITMAAEFADADIAARALPEILDDLGRTNWQVNRELGEDYDRHVTAKGFVASLRRLRTPALLLHGDPEHGRVAPDQALSRKPSHQVGSPCVQTSVGAARSGDHQALPDNQGQRTSAHEAAPATTPVVEL
jgi:proline iminopeptidase